MSCESWYFFTIWRFVLRFWFKQITRTVSHFYKRKFTANKWTTSQDHSTSSTSTNKCPLWEIPWVGIRREDVSWRYLVSERAASIGWLMWPHCCRLLLWFATCFKFRWVLGITKIPFVIFWHYRRQRFLHLLQQFFWASSWAAVGVHSSRYAPQECVRDPCLLVYISRKHMCFLEISALCVSSDTLSGKIYLRRVGNPPPDSQDPHREFLGVEQRAGPKITSARNKMWGRHLD